MDKFLYNNQILLERRKYLRNNLTEPEKILWQQLSKNKIDGFRFFRQYSVGPYILDFYCPKKRLGIEIDGLSHNPKDTKIYDGERTLYLKSVSIKILRFKNEEVIQNVKSVTEKIRRAFASP